MVFRTDDEAELEGEMDDEEATLADDLLDEVGADDEEAGAEDIEGFGHIVEEEVKEPEEEVEGEKAEEDAPLEEDAEDVDFDTFDDVDEM